MLMILTRLLVLVTQVSHQNECYHTQVNHTLNKKAVLPQGNRAMLQVFFSVEVRQTHSLQV